jgi:DNA-binding transcriptional LysR family regulator
MAPIDLNLLRVFATVYRAGSFTAAATELGVPRSTVSRAIAALEDRIGDELVHRTTRTMSISDEGKALFDRIAPSLGGLEAALDDLPVRAGDEPSGTVRVTSTPDIGASLLAEAAVRFTARFPRAQVELMMTPAVLDLVRDCDLALRVVRSRLPDSRLVARKVGAVVFHWFASPTYLARRGPPRSPGEAGHEWIALRGMIFDVNSAVDPRQTTEGRLLCNDIFLVRELGRRGGGIAGLPSYFAEDDLRAGTLIRVLPKATLLRASLYLVHAARRHLPPRLTAFRDLLIEILRQRPLAPADSP